jgi:hypothetical protein
LLASIFFLTVVVYPIQNATHPLFNLTMTHTDAMMGYFYGQVVPRRGG